MNRPTARGDHVIAATFSTDAAEVRAMRYHEGRTPRAVYAIGDEYFTTGRARPRMLGLTWIKHPDQFFAERAGTVLWVANIHDGEGQQ